MESLVVQEINHIMASNMKGSKKVKAIRSVLDRWYCLLNHHKL